MHLGLVLHDSGFRLTKRFTKRPRIDLEKQITLINVRALGKFDADQWTADLSFYLNGRVRFDVSNRMDFNRDRLLNSGLHTYRDRRKRGTCTAASASTATSAPLWHGATTGEEHDN